MPCLNIYTDTTNTVYTLTNHHQHSPKNHFSKQFS